MAGDLSIRDVAWRLDQYGTAGTCDKIFLFFAASCAFVTLRLPNWRWFAHTTWFPEPREIVQDLALQCANSRPTLYSSVFLTLVLSRAPLMIGVSRSLSRHRPALTGASDSTPDTGRLYGMSEA